MDKARLVANEPDLSAALPRTPAPEAWARRPIEVAVPPRLAAPLGKSVAIVQSNYIPWKGYFDLINSVDEFIFFDDVQYTRRDWRNRNRIKTREGLLWLSIPVSSKGRYREAIRDITVSDAQWAQRHWKTIATHYARARHFKDYAERLQELYLGTTESRLSEINQRLIQGLCALLGISTRLSSSAGLRLPEGRTERILGVCRAVGACQYLSGPTARSYLDHELFRQEGLGLSYFEYAGYPEYRQLFPPFEHRVSVLDLILNEGPDARRYLLSS